jgi:hypothetical protein
MRNTIHPGLTFPRQQVVTCGVVLPTPQDRIDHERTCRLLLTHSQLQAKITELEGKGSEVLNKVSEVVGSKTAPRLILIGPPGAGESE